MKAHSIPRQARDGEQTCLERSRKSRTILTLAMMVLWSGAVADARYSGGTGEPNDPYRIATDEDLNDIGNYEPEDWGKHFVLVNDVNLAQYTGTQFKVIGRYITWNDPNNKPFTGVFDGNDHKVWSFAWNSTGRKGIGLFGYVGEGSQIKNLGLENVDINAVNGIWVGGLVGFNVGGTITNCYSTGSVSGKESVGGLVGYTRGTITNCYSIGSITGTSDVGGLVGINSWDGTITDCYSTSRIIGRNYVGGLVGYNIYGTITNCYSTGSVSGGGYYDYVGGLVGFNVGGTINNCYSSGSVSGDWCVGGLVGYNNEGTITNCYSSGSVSGNDNVGGLVGSGDPNLVIASFWDKDTSGQTTSAGGEAKTTAEMKTMSTFTDAGWDFVEIWGIGENQTYPFLRTEPAGDSNHDKKVDFVDLAILSLHWLEEK